VQLHASSHSGRIRRRTEECAGSRSPYKRHRFPPDVIRLAVWLYFRFTFSLRDVEEMLAQRGIEASYETVRCWTLRLFRAKADRTWAAATAAAGAIAPSPLIAPWTP
jgi:transposase-like protein